MKEEAARMLLAAFVFCALAALLASRAYGRIPEGTGTPLASQTVVAQPIVVPYLSHGIGVDRSLSALRTRDRVFAPQPARARVVSRHSDRLFVWPTQGTSTFQRAARMARHGDPEAQSFVSGLSDINPFGAQ